MTISRETIVLKGKLYAVGVLGLLGLLVVCYTVIASVHGDTGGYLTFAGPIVSVLISTVLISKQIDDVRQSSHSNSQKLNTVVAQTNGQLTNQIIAVHDHIETATGVPAPPNATPATVVNPTERPTL